MLQAYFDDSGTHGDSEVVAVGGLIGTPEQWKAFEKAWITKLAVPLPGKPPLKAFHLSHCQASWGEFRSYTRTESDAVTHDFRQIIIAAKLISTSSAVNRKAWDELVTDPQFGSPLEQCVQNCMLETNKIANMHPEGDRVAVVIDKGIRTQRLKNITNQFTFPLGRPQIVSVRFLVVADIVGLQGADTPATE